MPKIYSIVVISTQPAIAFLKREAFFIANDILESPKNDVPPANAIDQCVLPRHKISIRQYPIAPIPKVVKLHFVFFKTITQKYFG